MSFLPIYIYFIATSLLASIVMFTMYKKRYRYLIIFPPFLLATLIAEYLGSYLWSVGKNNQNLYNFFTAFEFCFYLYFIYGVIENKRLKKSIIIFIFLYAIIASVNIIFIQGVAGFHTVTYSLGCLLVVSYCIYYFLELFRLSKSVKLINEPAFWICSALLFFYCCGFPLYGLINYLSQISTIVVTNFDLIVTILNIFLYSLFTIAFLCIKTRKYTSSPS